MHLVRLNRRFANNANFTSSGLSLSFLSSELGWRVPAVIFS